MERLFHNVSITVFCKSYDDPKRVLAGLDRFSPVSTGILLAQEAKPDPDRPNTLRYTTQEATLTVQGTECDSGLMRIYTLQFRGMNVVNAFARTIFAALGAKERAMLREEPSYLLDHEGRLSLRLDKESLMDGLVVHTTSGNCYQIKAAVAAYPNTRERALAVLRGLLDSSS